ncbi:polyketide synthase [Verminephrobacter aporrectodeae subsp. tuberculatae]|nr:polyketide synthase [Verminephrobacter aporrectodeae subsp. tuberculatae]
MTGADMSANKHWLDQHPDAVAIIGMAGRFAEAPNLANYWDNLAAGKLARKEYSRDELLARAVKPEVVDDPAYVCVGMPLEDINCFDAEFFGVSAKQADWMDPQIRLFLEVCWHAMEDAGYDVSRLGAQRVGVFAGSNPAVYLWQHHLDRLREHNLAQWLEVLTSNDKDYLSPWVAYKLGLRGPALNIQTACSTSLVAVATACQNLLGYQCDMALAGAAALTLPHDQGYLYQANTILSPDGHCRPFDAEAAGTIMGNGVAAVLLKRAEDAIHDGDHIDALILGTAVNNDAQRKMDFMAPGVDGQAEVIRMAHRLAGVSADTIDYVETHGTGTYLGDPIEFRALQIAFAQGAQRMKPCAIGAVKANLGHLNTAAGMAGLIKTVLALQHEMLPPTPHFKQPNPQLDLEGSPFFINDRLRPWPREPGRIRRAGVSAFGFGGTNAHVVLQEAPEPERTERQLPAHLFVLSARDAAALDRYRERIQQWVAGPGRSTDLADLCFTAAHGRRGFSHRLALMVRDTRDLAVKLPVATAASAEPTDRVAWVFTGQGAQYKGMASGLYQHVPVFRRTADACNSALSAEHPLPLAGWLSGQFDMAPALDQAATLQPLLFTIQYALAEAWREFGIRPDMVLGHSLGEYVAACVAGVMSLETAMTMVCLRGRLLDRLPSNGGMLAVKASDEEVRQVLRDGYDLDVAADNAPDQIVVSGHAEEIDRFRTTLGDAGVDSVRLTVTHAFHSRLLDPILEEFEAGLSSCEFSPPAIPMLSNLSGTLLQVAPDARYWRNHLRQTVRFTACLEQLQAQNVSGALEIGTKPLLTGLVARRLPQGCLPGLVEGASGYQAWLGQVGQAFCSGMVSDIGALYPQGRRISFPGYPFTKSRHWIDSQEVAGTPSSQTAQQVDVQQDPLFDLVAGYWRHALGAPALSRSSDFFMLGGNSLAAIQIRAAVQRDLAIDLPMAEMMKMRTLGDLVDAIALVLEAEAASEVQS